MKLQIAIVGDFRAGYEPHAVTNDFFAHAAAHSDFEVAASWLPTDQVTAAALRNFDALWIAPGSPYRSMEGALTAIRFARENRLPLGGACAGFQHVVLEYVRNVLGIANAAHAEYDPPAGSVLVLHRLVCVVAGKELPITFAAGSLAAQAYGRTDIVERYYCSFGLNPEFRQRLRDLRVTGWDDLDEARVVELQGHPYFVATLFVPQSTPTQPHPLALAFLNAADRATTIATARPQPKQAHASATSNN